MSVGFGQPAKWSEIFNLIPAVIFSAILLAAWSGFSSANAHDSWSTADVRGTKEVGGLIGRVSGARDGDFVGQLGRRRCERN